MRPLKVLITNGRLAKRTGTELYVVELALELLRRGHRPVVFAPRQGALADELRARTVPVAAQLDQIGLVPDVIHGHHRRPTTLASLRFPSAPVLFFCHAWNSPDDAPPPLPAIRRYVAVDEACRDRLVGECGVDERRVCVVHNFVNLERFEPRGPLPPQPKRALLFTNRAAAGPYVLAVRRACAARGIALDRLRGVAGKSCPRPEDFVGRYDIVFARAKAAIESMAVGAAVILCDRRGLGPMVTPDNLPRLREQNFGRRTLVERVTRESVERALAAYDPQAAAEVSREIRKSASLELTTERLLELYRAAIDEQAASPLDLQAQLVAAAGELERQRPLLDAGARQLGRQARLRAARRVLAWPLSGAARLVNRAA